MRSIRQLWLANPPYDGHPSGIARKSRSAAPPESERRACLRPSTGLHESVRLRVCCQRAAAPPYLTCCQRAARSCAGPRAQHLVDKPPIAFTNAGERHAEPAAARRESRATKSHSDRRECCEPTLPAAHPRCVSAAPSSHPALRLVRPPGSPSVRGRQSTGARLFALTWRSPRKSPETTRIACAT